MSDERLQAIKERFSRVTFMLGRSNGKTQLIQDINDLIECGEENKRLREALSYYADRKHYEPYGMASKNDFASDITEDEGEIARQALGGDSK